MSSLNAIANIIFITNRIQTVVKCTHSLSPEPKVKTCKSTYCCKTKLLQIEYFYLGYIKN